MWIRFRILSGFRGFRFLGGPYKKARNAAIASRRKARRKFEKKLGCNRKNDSKTFYRYVRSKSRTKDIIGPLKDDRGNIVTNDGQMADILNNFFSSVLTKENKDMLEVTMRCNGGDERSLRDIIITPDMVKLKISKLKQELQDKTPGDDGITPKFLKEVVDEIAEPLTEIFNKSISEGVVPQDWKIAKVTPIFKKGTKLDLGNYRLG